MFQSTNTNSKEIIGELFFPLFSRLLCIKKGTFKLKSSGHKFLNTSQESKSINYLFPFPQLVTKPTLKDQNNPHASSGKTSESHNQAKFKLIEERQSQELIVEKRRSNRLKTRNLKWNKMFRNRRNGNAWDFVGDPFGPIVWLRGCTGVFEFETNIFRRRRS